MNGFYLHLPLLTVNRVSALDRGGEHGWLGEALASLIRFLCGVEQVNELQREWPQLLVAPQSQKL